jgi:hypothetical protein
MGVELKWRYFTVWEAREAFGVFMEPHTASKTWVGKGAGLILQASLLKV